MATPIQTGFNGGKFGSRMKGRSDLSRYKFACEELQNFIPTVQGSAVKRSGTRFVKEAISPTEASRLINFNFSNVQSYIIEIGAGEMRFFRNSGAILEAFQTITGSPTAADPVVVPLTAHPYSNGDSVYITGSPMSELNGRFFTVANQTTNAFELSGEDGTSRVTGSGGTTSSQYHIQHGISSDDIPWLASELNEIQYVQNGDLLYLTHPNHPPHEIVRVSDTSWTCLAYVSQFPPLESENTDKAVTMSIDNASIGAGQTLTAVGRLFVAADIGRTLSITEDLGAFSQQGKWIANSPLASGGLNQGIGTASEAYDTTGSSVYWEGRVYKYSSAGVASGNQPPTHETGNAGDGSCVHTFVNFGTGYGTITAVAANGLTATITVVVEFPASCDTASHTYNGATTHKWAFGAWDAVNGYPAAVAFYEDRLWFGGTNIEPQTVWASFSGEYDNFRIAPADLDDTGMQFSFLSDTLNKIQWMQGDDVLLAGTAGGEFSIDAGSAAQAVTPSNIRVRRRANYGSKNAIQPKALDSALVFVRQNSDVHKLTFSFDSDRYIAPDLTMFSHNILRPGVVSLDYQPDPFRQLWALKSDGTLASLTFDEIEDVIAWADVIIGGTDTVVDSLSVIPHPDGDEDQVWMTVSRTVSGATKRFVEILEKPYDEDTLQKNAFFVDAGSTYTGAPATIITGLWHLEGETVVILADGARLPDQTVTLGTITLDAEALIVHAGLPMASARLRTLPWNSSNSTTQSGSSIGWTGRVSSLIIHVDQTGNGLEYGSDFGSMDAWERRETGDAMDTPVALYSGESPVFGVPGGFAQTRQIAVRYDEPLPCTIVAFSGQVEIGVP